MKNQPVTLDQYIETFPEPVREVLQALRKTIQKMAPKAVETMSYGMPAYKINGKPLVYFAAYKNHIGFYALPSGNAAFQKKLANYKTGKGSIQFPLEVEMPWNLIESIVSFRMKEIANK